MRADLTDRPYEIHKAGVGWTLRTRPADVAMIRVAAEPDPKATPVSQGDMAVLVAIAWHQPITRAEIAAFFGGRLNREVLERLRARELIAFCPRNPRFVASLQASAGLLAPIIPPSILMILYGSIVNVSIGGLFLAAVVPGLLIALGLMVMVFILTSPRFQPDIERERFAGMQRIREAGIRAIPALGMPVIIIGGIVGGVFTATEAGAVAVVYSFVIGKFFYRSFKFSEVPEILLSAGSLTVMVMSIIVFAAAFGWLLAMLGVPALIIDFMTNLTENPYVFLMLTIAFVLVLGTVMEVLAIATIFGPLLNTLAIYYGFDPVYFGVIVAISMQIGGITPPVGILLNITCGIAGTRPGQCLGYIGLFILVILLVLALIIVFPDIAMFLPQTFL